MSWLQLIFDTSREQASTLEDALLELGALSVTLQDNVPEDGVDEPIYEPDRGATPLWQKTRLLALFDADTDADLLAAALNNALADLPPFRAEILQDQPWERAWMADFKPLRFGRRLWICPSWCEPPDPDGVILALDPGLAFGTGTHPTTALCLEWLDAQALAGHLKGRTVLDYGCGSGILAIAALLLGAERAVAVDNDPQALIATRDNAERNGISPERLATYLPDDAPAMSADVTVANILAGPLQSLAPVLTGLTRPGGRLALSGILGEQANAVAGAYRPAFTLFDPAISGDWVRIDGYKVV
ncbi:MAG: 50S ribosomal protein L11 methyltransferase [Spongiibacteraceae bacterium]